MFSWEITSVTGGKSWFWAIQCSWMPSWVYWPMSLAGGASPPRRRRFTQVSEYWPFFQLFLFNQARHKPFGGSSDAFRILNEKIPSALNFSFFSTLLLVQSAFFSLSPVSFSRSFFWFGDPEFGVSSYLLFFQSRQEEGNDGPSLVKVIGENEARCTEYTAAEITYFHLLCSLRCFHPTRRRGKQWHLISFQYQKNFLWLCVCIGFPSPFHSVIFQNTLHIQHEKWWGDGWWQQSQ